MACIGARYWHGRTAGGQYPGPMLICMCPCQEYDIPYQNIVTSEMKGERKGLGVGGLRMARHWTFDFLSNVVYVQALRDFSPDTF